MCERFKFLFPYAWICRQPINYLVLTPGNLASSVYSATQKIDTGEVLGTGLNHVLSTTQIELRKEVFDHLHENLLDYLPKGDNQDNIP